MHADESVVKLLVIRTNEEREIAEQTRAVLAGRAMKPGGYLCRAWAHGKVARAATRRSRQGVRATT